MKQKPDIFILPFKMNNQNQGQSKHWGMTHTARKKFEKQIRELGLTREPYELPVKMVVTRILGKNQRMWDMSSGFRGNWKQIQDSLVSCGWFYDDGPKWITEILFKQDDTRRKDGPAIEVAITVIKEKKC